MNSSKQVEMYWDAGSTNTYFAIKLIKPILERHGATLVLHPYNVGYVFRSNNYELMKEPKEKLRYRKADLMRWAAKYRLPFQIPRQFPIKSSRILRGSLAMRRQSLEIQFVEAVFDAYWERGDASVTEFAGLRPIVESLGVEPDWFEHLAASDEIAAEVAASTDRGIQRGVFGVPSIFVGDAMFWGKDRMEFVDEELERLGASQPVGTEDRA
ncbi:2-hydroxychromene-2-carboxylate isomerase [Variovorax sp. WS11]|uniref:2-hydroxychromene-2-carboxylate isomerase n=1 Tax=Variovorax sp. WS11 TaxID=1105204 RepID=UPI000D0E19C8|nr:2-hydroxychromene-2-carboxylate isomerase [Variovorax sp. WS11]NDZ14802.1 2-hydroxychromene-2-carboxylate isomerase [Variovorax sp. WS11]PSL85677.1 2-hydroxychromene-2-carboxylate isomerase [Variovorax sp. WS11]